MKQLPGILIAIGVTLIALTTLTISILRLTLPHLTYLCPQIVSILNHAFNANIQLQQLNGSWQSFGPILDINNIDATTSNKQLHVQRITIAVDVWQSLLHWRWQFRDVTFYHLQLNLESTLTGLDYHDLRTNFDRLSNLFMHQLDYFILRDSQITFLSPSGKQIQLSIPQLTWLNTSNRHRAEGKINLLSTEVPQVIMDVRIDLYDQQGFLDNGKVYLQASDVNFKPWLNKLLKSNTVLQNANFNLSSWLTIEKGNFTGATVLLSQGTALWQDSDQIHQLNIDSLTLHLSKQLNTWQIDIPTLNIVTDGQSCEPGSISLSWLPTKQRQLSLTQKGEIRLRANKINLEQLSIILLPLVYDAVPPTLRAYWHNIQPRGILSALALDIPLDNPKAIRFQARWHNIGWQTWELLPGAEHVSGSIEGSLAYGRLQIALDNSTLPYPSVFRAPLALSHASATFNWYHNQQKGLMLLGRHIDAQTQSLWAHGDLFFHKPIKSEPWLDILIGIRLDNAADAWRYFPEPLIGASMLDYLTGALKGGKVDNATLVFAGNPCRLPFTPNNNQFGIWIPLKQVKYEFEPGWPVLTQLDINLDFVNNSLFMYTPKTMLGEIKGLNVTANIPDFSKEKLLIDASLTATGSTIRNYFLQTPLRASLGKILDELQIGGKIHGNMHLNIPLNGQPITATGNIALQNNSLFIKSLNTTVHQINGNFHYSNGNLYSTLLNAQWLGQPITLKFTTMDKLTALDIKISLKGNWVINQLSVLPVKLKTLISGFAVWRSDISVIIPKKGNTSYQVLIKSNLKNISSNLPEPLKKTKSQPLTLMVNATGDLYSFTLSGHVGNDNSFNSQWLLGRPIILKRGAWASSSNIPPLPDNHILTLSLPALNGEKWLALLKLPSTTKNRLSAIRFLSYLNTLILRTPVLTMGGQNWNQLVLTHSNVSGTNKVDVNGKEINGKLTMAINTPWHIDLAYLYYNPIFNTDSDNNSILLTEPFLNYSNSFIDWPALSFTCHQCWIKGHNLGQISATIQPQKNALILTDSIINTGNAQLTIEGNWLHNHRENLTSLKGTLSGKDISTTANYIGIDLPLHETPFNLDYELQWREEPWRPDITSLNGMLHSQLGKGKINNTSSSGAGRLLRLISFDALLRKLQFDFSDTFGEGFYFDSIKGTAWLKDGILYTNDLLIDGLEADIAMTGNINLNHHLINIEAVITPEISTTIGVAAAFMINPIVGIVVFAASKVLAPLWNKVSLIRFYISGNLDAPKIQEVLYQSQTSDTKLK